MRISDWSSDVCSSDLLEISPFNGRVEVLRKPTHEVGQATVRPQNRRNIAEAMWPAANAHVPSPAWPSQRLQQPASGRKWSGHPGMCIPIARAGHRHVDREDKRLAPLLGRHRQKIAHKGAIPYHIELKPDRTRAAHDLR